MARNARGGTTPLPRQDFPAAECGSDEDFFTLYYISLISSNCA
jgi:hypothetical protein